MLGIIEAALTFPTAKAKSSYAHFSSIPPRKNTFLWPRLTRKTILPAAVPANVATIQIRPVHHANAKRNQRHLVRQRQHLLAQLHQAQVARQVLRRPHQVAAAAVVSLDTRIIPSAIQMARCGRSQTCLRRVLGA